jgi:hypothetical protein
MLNEFLILHCFFSNYKAKINYCEGGNNIIEEAKNMDNFGDYNKLASLFIY